MLVLERDMTMSYNQRDIMTSIDNWCSTLTYDMRCNKTIAMHPLSLRLLPYKSHERHVCCALDRVISCWDDLRIVITCCKLSACVLIGKPDVLALSYHVYHLILLARSAHILKLHIVRCSVCALCLIRSRVCRFPIEYSSHLWRHTCENPNVPSNAKCQMMDRCKAFLHRLKRVAGSVSKERSLNLSQSDSPFVHLLPVSSALKSGRLFPVGVANLSIPVLYRTDGNDWLPHLLDDNL
jgi:hypothetical protein